MLDTTCRVVGIKSWRACLVARWSILQFEMSRFLEVGPCTVILAGSENVGVSCPDRSVAASLSVLQQLVECRELLDGIVIQMLLIVK